MKKKKRSILPILAFFMLAAGVLVILFPYIRQYQYELETNKLIQEYEERNDERQTDNQDDILDPFSGTDEEITSSDEGEVFGYITIPAMDIQLPIYLGASEENLKKGAANLTDTSLPVGGESTNAVLAAHRGYSQAAMFRDIEKIQLGDEFFIRNPQGELTYKAVEVKVISPEDVHELKIQEGRDLVTLITCHPYGQNYQRYVVYGERVIEE